MLSYFDYLIANKEYFAAIASAIGFFMGVCGFLFKWSKHRLDKPILKIYIRRDSVGVIKDYNNGKTQFTGDCLIVRIKNLGRQPFYVESVGIFNHEKIFCTRGEVGDPFSLSYTDKPREFTFPVTSIIEAFRQLADKPESRSITVWGCVNHTKENEHLSTKKFKIHNSENTV